MNTLVGFTSFLRFTLNSLFLIFFLPYFQSQSTNDEDLFGTINVQENIKCQLGRPERKPIETSLKYAFWNNSEKKKNNTKDLLVISQHGCVGNFRSMETDLDYLTYWSINRFLLISDEQSIRWSVNHFSFNASLSPPHLILYMSHTHTHTHTQDRYFSVKRYKY